MNIQVHLSPKKNTNQNILFFKECLKIIEDLNIRYIFEDITIIYDKEHTFTINENELCEINKLLYKKLIEDLFDINVDYNRNILNEESYLINEKEIISYNNHSLMYLLIDNHYYFHSYHIFEGWRSMYIYLYML